MARVCFCFSKLKVQSVQDSYVMKPLTFNSLVLVPQTMSTPSYPVPVGDSSYSGGSQITMAPVLSVSSTDKSLHVNMTLSEETEIDLPPRISEGNTVITIESYNNSQNDFTVSTDLFFMAVVFNISALAGILLKSGSVYFFF